MSIVYSPLCNTSLVAYTSYLLACSHGSVVDGYRGGSWRRFESSLGNGDGDFGGRDVVDVGTLAGAARLVSVGSSWGRGRSRSVDSVHSSVRGAWASAVGSAGFAALCVDSDCGGVDSDGGVDGSRCETREAGPKLRDEPVALNEDQGVVPVRGKNYERNRKVRERVKRRKAEVGSVGGVQGPVGVRDVATKEQLVELAKQRAELYKLENERRIIKARREIAMENKVAVSGAQEQRVDNWISDVKKGSSKSSGSGWASPRSAKTKWSGSWRSRETVVTGDTSVVTGVSEEVHKAVLSKVDELEKKLAHVQAVAASKASEAASATARADVQATRLKEAELMAAFLGNGKAAKAEVQTGRLEGAALEAVYQREKERILASAKASRELFYELNEGKTGVLSPDDGTWRLEGLREELAAATPAIGDFAGYTGEASVVYDSPGLGDDIFY